MLFIICFKWYFLINILDQGHLFCWGHNYYNELGDGTKENKNTPQILKYFENKKIIKIFTSTYNLFVKTSNKILITIR